MLDSFQSDCVNAEIESNLLILAGPGAGKTTVMVSRVDYLIKNNVSPERIMMTTFTTKAANELKTRLAQLIGENTADRVQIGTYHSLALKCLRQNGLLNEDCTILDGSTVMLQCMKSYLGKLKLSEYHTQIDAQWRSRRLLLNPGPVLPILKNGITAVSASIVNDAFVEFEKYKKDNELVEFDDLITMWLEYLNLVDDTGVNHFIGDEIQDANEIQHEIANVLASKGAFINIVGDDCQSIYGFRGSSMNPILQFTDIFPNSRLFKLENNYRSTPEIVAVSEAIISFNATRIQKNVRSTRENGLKPIIYGFETTRDELSYIVETCKRAIQNTMEVGGLFRLNSSVDTLENELRLARVPFQLLKGKALLERNHVKAVISFLRFIFCAKTADHVLMEVLQLHKGVGPAKTRKLVEALALGGGASASVMQSFISMPNLDASLRQMQQILSAASVAIFAIHRREIGSFAAYSDQVLSATSVYFANSLLANFSHCARADEHPDDIQLVASMVKRSYSFTDFLDAISLHKETRADEQLIKIGTIHAAKGLEFETTIVGQCSDGLIPFCKAKTRLEFEEERRLLYVASSRAKDQLCFTFSKFGLHDSEKANRFSLSHFLQPLLSSGLFDVYGCVDQPTPQTTAHTDIYKAISNFQMCFGRLNVLHGWAEKVSFCLLPTTLEACPLAQRRGGVLSVLTPTAAIRLFFSTLVINIFTNDDDMPTLIHLSALVLPSSDRGVVTGILTGKTEWPKFIQSVKNLVEQLLAGSATGSVITESTFRRGHLSCCPHVIIGATILSVKYDDRVTECTPEWALEIIAEAAIVKTERVITTAAVINLYTGQLFRAKLSDLPVLTIPSTCVSHPVVSLLSSLFV